MVAIGIQAGHIRARDVEFLYSDGPKRVSVHQLAADAMRGLEAEMAASGRQARAWDGWNEWEVELTDFLSLLSSRNDETGQRAEGLGQFLPELRAAFARAAATPAPGGTKP